MAETATKNRPGTKPQGTTPPVAAPVPPAPPVPPTEPKDEPKQLTEAEKLVKAAQDAKKLAMDNYLAELKKYNELVQDILTGAGDPLEKLTKANAVVKPTEPPKTKEEKVADIKMAYETKRNEILKNNEDFPTGKGKEMAIGMINNQEKFEIAALDGVTRKARGTSTGGKVDRSTVGNGQGVDWLGCHIGGANKAVMINSRLNGTPKTGVMINTELEALGEKVPGGAPRCEDHCAWLVGRAKWKGLVAGAAATGFYLTPEGLARKSTGSLPQAAPVTPAAETK